MAPKAIASASSANPAHEDYIVLISQGRSHWTESGKGAVSMRGGDVRQSQVYNPMWFDAPNQIYEPLEHT
jgi:hypothetical protein